MHSLRPVLSLICGTITRRFCSNETVLICIDKAQILRMSFRNLRWVRQLTLIERGRVAAFHVVYGHASLTISKHITVTITLENLLSHIDQLAVRRAHLMRLPRCIELTGNVHGVASFKLQNPIHPAHRRPPLILFAQSIFSASQRVI